MTTRVPPARPRQERRAEAERAAYKRMVRGQLTADQYLEALVAPRTHTRRFWRWPHGR